jgi:hypothetical protein
MMSYDPIENDTMDQGGCDTHWGGGGCIGWGQQCEQLLNQKIKKTQYNKKKPKK